MANRYANLVGSNKIKDEYTKINQGFDAVEADIDAKPNKSVAQVNDIEFEADDSLTVEAGTGITVTTTPAEKKLRITATGEATPGPHGAEHDHDGADPIPELIQVREDLAAHKAETVTSVNAVAGYGADPTGATDTIAQLTAAATAAAGKTLFLPPGNYQVGSTLSIPDDTTVFAYGAKIFDDSNHITLLSLGNNVKIYGLEIEGAGNSTAATNGVGILCSGTDAQNYRKSIVIEDCKIHDLGFYGVHGEWVEDLQINRCEIYNCGYAGVGLLSAVRCHVTKSYIHDISPGSAANAYGVYFSRRGNKTSLTDFPRSRDCSATDNIIENIPIWEALDSHGGDNILFSRNIIRNCKIGIALVAATDDAGDSAYGIQNSKAIGNTIFGIGDGYGIVVKGVANDYACNNEIANNTLIECGQQGQALSGAIYAEYTKGLVVSVNTLRNCYANGIHLFNENRSFSCTGNVVVDVQDDTFAAPACISFRSTNNDGVLSGNTLSRDNTSLNTYVSEIGINFSSATGIDVVVIGNKNDCVIPVNGGNGPHIKYGVHGNNMFKFVGTGSPEGVVTAPVGSEYTNTSGGAATTLYIKTSGTGNTGWTAK